MRDDAYEAGAGGSNADLRPARGYSWPPFAPGHRLSTTHGAYAPREWQPLADAIARELADIAPWCSRPAYAAAVGAWARVEAQLQLVMVWLDEHGPLDDDGVPRPATALQTRLEGQAQSLRAELGLSPLALAKLLGAFQSAAGADDPGALDALRAEGRRILRAREVAADGALDDTEEGE